MKSLPSSTYVQFVFVSYTSVKLWGGGGQGALLPRAQSHLVRALANEEWTSKEPEEKYIQDARITEASVYRRLLISDQVTTSSTHLALW